MYLWEVNILASGHISDVEFGRLQARDMLQHLWTGPISNSSVDVVQGSRSVEVRAVGVTKVTNLIYCSSNWLFSVDYCMHIHFFEFCALYREQQLTVFLERLFIVKPPLPQLIMFCA